MQVQSRSRAIRARLGALGLPAGALPLIAATVVLVAVPIARAAGDDGKTTSSPTGSGTAAPLAVEASRTPRISAKLERTRSLGGAAIRVSGRTTGTGRGKAHVRFAVRASGAKKWRTVSTANVKSGKRFKLSWRGGSPGRYMTRVSVRKFGKTAVDRTGRAYVFRRSYASYYGPGLYGGGLACGGRLSPNTIGVAHKTLPCGTRVTFTLGSGRVVTARVIDRGPYVGGRDWDLTAGLKRKLRFGDVGTVYATR